MEFAPRSGFSRHPAVAGLLPDAAPPSVDCVVDYRFLAERGIASVLEVSVLSVGFKGEHWGSDPPLSVFLSVRVRRYRTGDGRMREEKEWGYQGTQRKFPEWMERGRADGGGIPSGVCARFGESRAREMIRTTRA